MQRNSKSQENTEDVMQKVYIILRCDIKLLVKTCQVYMQKGDELQSAGYRCFYVSPSNLITNITQEIFLGIHFGIYLIFVQLALFSFDIYSNVIYLYLYNNQINARALIGQSSMGYCASKPMKISRVF